MNIDVEQLRTVSGTLFPNENSDENWAMGLTFLVTQDDVMGHTGVGVHPGDIVYGVTERNAPSFGAPVVAFHKECYVSPRTARGRVYASRMVALQPFTQATEVRPGDLLVASARDERTRGPVQFRFVDEHGRAHVAHITGPDSSFYDEEETALFIDPAYHWWRAPSIDWDSNSQPMPPVQHVDQHVQGPDVSEEARLRAQVEALQAELGTARTRHIADINTITAAFHDAAERHGYCSDYDEVVREVNRSLHVQMEERTREFTVTMAVSGSVEMSLSGNGIELEEDVDYSFTATVTVEAVNEDAAGEAVTALMVRNADWENVDSDDHDIIDYDDFHAFLRSALTLARIGEDMAVDEVDEVDE